MSVCEHGVDFAEYAHCVECSRDEKIELEDQIAELISEVKRLQEVTILLTRDNNDLKRWLHRDDCTQCNGSGTVINEREGSRVDICDCHAVVIDNLTDQVVRLTREALNR